MDALVLPVGVPVVIEVELEDCSDLGTPLRDPNGGVTLTLTRGPSKIAVIADQAMTRVRLGVYRFTYDPGESDPTGVYHGTVKTTHGGVTREHPLIGLFRLA